MERKMWESLEVFGEREREREEDTVAKGRKESEFRTQERT